MNNVPFISCSAVKVLAAQSSETALKLRSIWFVHYTFLFFRKMPLPLQKMFEQWIWHTFVISCNNECCPAHLKWENLPTSLKRIRSSTIKVLCYQLWATKSESPCSGGTTACQKWHSILLLSTAHLVCTFTLHLLIHQCHHIKHKCCLTSIYWQQQHSSVPQLLTSLCYILPAFLQSSTPDGAEQHLTFNILWKPESQVYPLCGQKEEKVSLLKFKIILLTKRKSIW